MSLFAAAADDKVLLSASMVAFSQWSNSASLVASSTPKASAWSAEVTLKVIAEIYIAWQ